jgi:hypothetical protein
MRDKPSCHGNTIHAASIHRDRLRAIGTRADPKRG